MDTMIIKISIWKNADKTETRYYVDAFRNEYEKQRGSEVAVIRHGCLYKTGNSWHAKGSKDGDLTAEEWQTARSMGTSTSWVAYYHPRYNDIVRGGTDYRPFDEAKAEAAALAERQAERAKRDSRLDTVIDVAGYGAIGSLVIVTKKDGSETIMVVLDTYEYIEEYEQSSSDRRQSGWYMRCVEPNELEKQRSDYVKLAAKVADRQSPKNKDLNDLAIRQFGISAPRIQTNEPDDELFNQLFGNGELDN